MKHNHERIQHSINKDKNLLTRISLKISKVFGSVWFLLSFIIFIVLYFLWNNNVFPFLRPFDNFPYNELELFLTIFSIILTISVLISQNRQSEIEEERDSVEFEINAISENEITKALTMLHEIQCKLGINKNDSELDEMMKKFNVENIHEKIKKDSPQN